MEQPHRIDPLSISRTTERQTPRNDFGEVLARTAGPAVRVASGLVGAIPGIGPVLSVALSGVSSVSQVATSRSGIGTGNATSLETPMTMVGGGKTSGSAFDLMEAQALLQENNQRFTAQYLQLQNEMQRESREYNAISNIMKARHDSAKAAINNVR